MNARVKGIVMNATIVTIFAFATKILGFLREAVLASYFGATHSTDAYFIATYIPTLINAFVLTALSTAAIPVFAEYSDESQKQHLHSLYSTVFHLVGLVLLLGVVLCAIFLSPIVRLLAPGFTAQEQGLTQHLALIMLPSLLLMGLTEATKNALHNEKDFLAPAVAGIPYNIVFITGIALSGIFWGIEGVACTSVVAFAAQLFVHLLGLYRRGYRYRFTLDLNHPGLRRIALLIAPTLLVTVVAQASGMVDRIIASGLAAGSLSSLNYAQRVQGIPHGLFFASLVTVLYPSMSDLGASKDRQGYESLFHQGITSLLLISVPMTLGMVMLRGDLVRLFFERGAFTPNDTLVTSYVLLFLAVGLPFAAVRDFLNRAFYSLQDTVTPMKISVALVSLDILLKFTLSRFMGIAGIAFSTSISAFLGCAVSVICLHRKHYIRSFAFILDGAKVCLASLAMAVSLMILIRLRQAIPLNKMLGQVLEGLLPDGLISFLCLGFNLGIEIILAGLVFFAASYLLRIEAAGYLWRLGRQVIRKIALRTHLPGVTTDSHP